MRLISHDDSETNVPSARCRDLWAWERAVLAADGLEVKGRVSARTVKAVALALRRHMNGPKKPDPGAGARPGTDRLVDELDLRRETIDRALAQLVKTGYLIRQVNGCRNRRAVYAAALPVDVAIANRLGPNNVARTPHLPKEVKTATTAQGQPQQLPIMAAVDERGGGGTPHGEQVKPVGAALRAVAESLPATLAAELLSAGDVDDIDQALTAIAKAGLPIADIVDGCTGRLPRVVGNIAVLLVDYRIPTLQRRAAGATRAGDTKRHARLAGARRIGDQHALSGDTRDDVVEHLVAAYPDDDDAQAAGVEAYDHAITAIEIEQEAG